jgi:hypothetical protein
LDRVSTLQSGFIRSWNDDTSEESRTLRRWSTRATPVMAFISTISIRSSAGR